MGSRSWRGDPEAQRRRLERLVSRQKAELRRQAAVIKNRNEKIRQLKGRATSSTSLLLRFLSLRHPEDAVMERLRAEVRRFLSRDTGSKSVEPKGDHVFDAAGDGGICSTCGHSVHAHPYRHPITRRRTQADEVST